MTDRELLELAAKAAGMKPASDGVIYAGLGSREWNPLTDDGDALRLAVKLRLDVIHNEPRDNDAWVMAGGDLNCVEDVEDESMRAAATRRAIVRAAAEIGRAMP